LQTSAPVIDALERLFALGDQRLSAPQVLDLLALEVVAARFEITPQDLELMTHWLTSTNVRWGMDAEHRHAHGHPRSDQNSWRLGLRRLFLGYAIESEHPALVFDTLPAEGIEGTEAAALGKLSAFVETLFLHVAALGAPHPPAEWPAVVGGALEALCMSDEETAWQHQEVREALSLLSTRARAAGYAEPIGGAAFGEILFETINAARPARGFLMGGVTFCSMVPLRTIPFRVVCMIGLGDRQFPRSEQSTDFDLIAHGPESRRIGDRSRRSEDRYLFLEAILSARERLIMTYTGQSIRDNAPLPPSVLVSELCDYLAASTAPGVARENALAGTIVRHPLQAFSRRYFDGSDPHLFSYAAHYLEGAASQAESAVTAPEFFPHPLPREPRQDPLAVGDLVRFYQNPTAYLLNRRLELFLREKDLDVPDREPQELSPLDKYTAGHELLELLLAGVHPRDAEPIIRATGGLPLGGPGDVDFLEIVASADGIAKRVLEARRGTASPPISIEHVLPSGQKLIGNLPESRGAGLLEYQFSRVRAKHLLGMWIRHLLYCWLGPSGASAESSLIGRELSGDGVAHHRFTAVPDPARQLGALVARYHEGQDLPLWLFPTTSLAYAEAQRKKAKPGMDLKATLDREWQTEVKREPHLTRVYGSGALLSELDPAATGRTSFEELALDVFGPLLDHLISSEKER
jgi:exodeoxyribonuclease V gamma subunit